MSDTYVSNVGGDYPTTPSYEENLFNTYQPLFAEARNYKELNEYVSNYNVNNAVTPKNIPETEVLQPISENPERAEKRIPNVQEQTSTRDKHYRRNILILGVVSVICIAIFIVIIWYVQRARTPTNNQSEIPSPIDFSNSSIELMSKKMYV